MTSDPQESDAEQLPRVLVIVGPTAAGKTRIAIRCALLLGAEIVSADSRQVYRFMDIGTAKPTPAERSRVPHHCIDILDPDQPVSAGAYAVVARQRVRDILLRGRRAIVAGGSGFYLRALIDGVADAPPADGATRGMLDRRLREQGLEALAGELRSVDPETAASADLQNPRRVIRALEVYHQTGAPISAFHRAQAPETEFEFVQCGPAWEREALYRRIDARVEEMLEAGLVEETAALLRSGYRSDSAPMRTVGYREAVEHLEGLCSAGEMRERIQRHTRNYAKRQETWFRADGRIRWYPVGEEGELDGIADRIADDFLSTS